MPAKGRRRAKGKAKVKPTTKESGHSDTPTDVPDNLQAKTQASSSLPSPLTSPSILRQILRHATDSSLFRCMLVSKDFYKVAGAILYREIHFPDTDMNKVQKGKDVIEVRATRNRPPIVNLKAELLAQTRILQISWHEYPPSYCCKVWSLPNLQTVRFLFAMWCQCPQSVHCELCMADTDLGSPCRLISSVNARKVVITSLRAYNSHAVLARLKEVLRRASIVTIILSPDSHSVQDISAEQISTLMEQLAENRSAMQLRLIVAPWSAAIKEIGEEDRGISRRLTMGGRCSENNDIVAFTSKVISQHYHTTIYLIESGPPAFDWNERWDGIVYDLDPTAIQEGVEKHFRKDTATCPKFSIKTRADYLAEGATDEIDEEELDWWRAEEKRKRDAQELEHFRQKEVEERRKLEEEFQEVAKELASSLAVSDWLDEWIEMEQERAKRDLHLLNALCIEMEMREEDTLEQGVDLWWDTKRHPRFVMELHAKAKEEIYDQLWMDWSLGRIM